MTFALGVLTGLVLAAVWVVVALYAIVRLDDSTQWLDATPDRPIERFGVIDGGRS